MIKCVQCGAPNADGRNKCYHCGLALPLVMQTKSSNKLPWIVVGVLATALIIVGGVTLSRRNSGTPAPVPTVAANNAQGSQTSLIPQTRQQAPTQQYPNTASPQPSQDQSSTNSANNTNATQSSPPVKPTLAELKTAVESLVQEKLKNNPDTQNAVIQYSRISPAVPGNTAQNDYAGYIDAQDGKIRMTVVVGHKIGAGLYDWTIIIN